MCISHIVARQRLGKGYPSLNCLATARQTLYRGNEYVEELLDSCVCGSLCVSPYRYYKNSVQTFPRQRIIAGGVVFYAVHVISNKIYSLQLFFRHI
jgi:hypothetical protein